MFRRSLIVTARRYNYSTKTYGDQTADKLKQGMKNMGEKMENSGSSMKRESYGAGTYENMKHEAGQKMEKAGQDLQHEASKEPGTIDKLKEGVHKATEMVKEGAEKVKEKVQDGAESIRDSWKKS